jgi:capsular exopolysaccharide synthesis family protein
VDRFVSMPTLGCVPRTQDDTQAPESELYTITSSAPQSLVAEAFRQVRTMLTFSCPPQEQTTVMITSPSPADGKTTVAVNLAVAAAQSGQKVLLVDANFRRPALQRIFPNLREEGLSNLLVGQVKMDQAIVHSEVPGLDVLSSGISPPNPAELLGSPHMRSFLAAATKQYDRIFIDTPPVLLLSDATALAGVVDGVLLVLRAHRSNRGAAARARQIIDSVNGRTFGVVLNAIKILRGGYFRKSYRQYYDYHRQRGEFGVSPMAAAGGQPPVPAS